MKIIIQKSFDDVYRVNGKRIKYSHRAGAWIPEDHLTTNELYHFHRFIELGKMDKQKLQYEIEKLEIKKQQLTYLLIEMEKEPKSLNKTRHRLKEKQLADVLEKLAKLKYNAVVYE
jgi:hypothetical protein